MCDLLQKIELIHAVGTQFRPPHAREVAKTLYEILTILDGKGLALLAFDGIVVVADSSFSALDLIAAVRHHVCFVTRLRLDASLFEPAPERRPGQNGRPPKKGRRLPKLAELIEDKKVSWTKLSTPY